MSKDQNINILKVINLTDEMIAIADEGDRTRRDRSCGVIFGILRDTAYHLRDLCNEEISNHYTRGLGNAEQRKNK